MIALDQTPTTLKKKNRSPKRSLTVLVAMNGKKHDAMDVHRISVLPYFYYKMRCNPNLLIN